jgi:DNA-binding transcriptional regulator YdaS (Cro superfamily)
VEIKNRYTQVVNWPEVHQELIQRVQALPHGKKKALAEHLGVAPAYLSQLLSGTRPITLERAQALASFLDVRLDHQILEG